MAAQKLKMSGCKHNGIVKAIMSRNSRHLCHCEPFSQELIAELKLNSFGCTSLEVISGAFLKWKHLKGCFVMEQSMNMHDLGVPLFQVCFKEHGGRTMEVFW